MPLQEKPKGYRRWTGTAILLCLCFVAGSILFLAQMGHQYNDESLLYLENAVRQHETALVKQVDGDFQTLHRVSVFVAEQDITDLEQLARLVGEVNEGNAFTCMGFATAEGRLELMELGGRRYRNLDVSGEDFFVRALAGEDVISAAIDDPFREGESVHYYAVPVQRADGQTLGVLCAVNSVAVIQEILDAPLLDGSGYTDLYSNTGAVILASSRDASAAPAALEELDGATCRRRWSSGRAPTFAISPAGSPCWRCWNPRGSRTGSCWPPSPCRPCASATWPPRWGPSPSSSRPAPCFCCCCSSSGG